MEFHRTAPLRKALLPLMFLAVVVCSFFIGVKYRTLRGAADGAPPEQIGHHECTAIAASALQERSLVLSLGSGEFEVSSVAEEASAVVEAEIWNDLDPSPDQDLLTYQDELLNALRYRDTVLLVTGDTPEGRVARGEPTSASERTARLARGVAIAAFVANNLASNSAASLAVRRGWDRYLSLLESDPDTLRAIYDLFALRSALRFVTDIEASKAECGSGPEGQLAPVETAVDRVLLQGRSILESGPDENGGVPAKEEFLASLYGLLIELRHARDQMRLREQEAEAARRAATPTPRPAVTPTPTATFTVTPVPTSTRTPGKVVPTGSVKRLPADIKKLGKQLPLKP